MWTVLVWAAAVGAPVCDVAQAHVDLGTASIGAISSYIFQISNSGDAPLEIREKATSCGSVSSALFQTIAPGASGRVKLAVKAEETVKSAHVALATNDPSRPLVVLSIAVRGVPEVRATPRALRPRRGATARVELSASSPDKTFRLLRVALPEGLRLAEPLQLPTTSQTTHMLTIEIDEMPAKTASIVLRTDARKQPIVEIPIEGDS